MAFLATLFIFSHSLQRNTRYIEQNKKKKEKKDQET
jgi:hypothetical protein